MAQRPSDHAVTAVATASAVDVEVVARGHAWVVSEGFRLFLRVDVLRHSFRRFLAHVGIGVGFVAGARLWNRAGDRLRCPQAPMCKLI